MVLFTVAAPPSIVVKCEGVVLRVVVCGVVLVMSCVVLILLCHLRSLLSARAWFFVWPCVVFFLSCRVLC